MKKLTDLIKESFTIKNIVAAGIGAALFVIVGMFAPIPTGVPNTDIQLQYAVIALLAVIYGPTTGFLSGFIGHALKDAFQYGNPWWTWVLMSGLIGLVLGFLKPFIKIDKGQLTLKDYLVFNVTQVLTNVLAWGFVAPFLDIVIYHEAKDKVYAQGLVSSAVNAATVAIGGTLLLSIYAKSRTKSGSLSKD